MIQMILPRAGQGWLGSGHGLSGGPARPLSTVHCPTHHTHGGQGGAGNTRTHFVNIATQFYIQGEHKDWIVPRTSKECTAVTREQN